MTTIYVDSIQGFSSDTTVILENEDPVLVVDLKHGDVLLGGGVVSFIVKTPNHDSVQMMKIDQSLEITEKQPLYIHGGWKFCSKSQHDKIEPLFIYNIVTQSDTPRTMYVGETMLKTTSLGYTFSKDTNNHPYFSTKLVLDDLKVLPKINNIVSVKKFIVDRDSGLVCGLHGQTFYSIF